MTDTLPVNEIFETFQGEAHFTGTPAIFIRLQGCDVGCPWCDTKHTWALDPANEVPAEQVAAKVEDAPTFGRMTVEQLVTECSARPSRHVVITGGEPARYDLLPLSRALAGAGKTVQLETSGTHPVSIGPRAWVTVSPKIGMPGGYGILPQALGRADEIKYPVGKVNDLNELMALLRHGDNRVDAEIWLQPLSQSKRATEICMAAARDHGWRVSLQTHKFLGVR